MAFYGTPYSVPCDYDFAPNQFQPYSSAYESGEHELIDYKSSAYYTDHYFVSANSYSDPAIVHYDPIQSHSSYDCYQSSINPYDYYESYSNPSQINYSVYNYSEPKLLQYEPPSDFRSETKFTVSHSTVEFNEPEFEEYDTTPYGGGYDPAATYGKPLPPSDTICYPRSTPRSDIGFPENFSYASIPSPYGKDDDLEKKPVNESKPVDAKTETKTLVENGDDDVTSDSSDDENAEPLDLVPSNDDTPVFEHENGFENGTNGDYGYGYGSESQMPYGSGLETIDLCESIFGHWPCLDKIERQKRFERSQICDQERRMDPWETAADYLFGSPLVYDNENHHHHHQQQLVRYENYDNSWSY